MHFSITVKYELNIANNVHNYGKCNYVIITILITVLMEHNIIIIKHQVQTPMCVHHYNHLVVTRYVCFT